MKYFRDVNTDFIVRKPDESVHLEYTYDDLSEWTQTEYDSSYEQEYYFGQGNTWLFDITEEEAIDIICSRKNSLSESQILVAKNCFCFSDDTIYIETCDADCFFVYNLTSKTWSKRKNDNFGDSFDSAPHLFLPISNNEAVTKIFHSDNECLCKANIDEDRQKTTESKSTIHNPESKNIIRQMVDGIMGKESKNPNQREKEIRRQLSGRALEYLMFLDDEEE